MIFKSKDANYDFGALISNKGFVMVDISEQSLVFHLYFQKKKLARTFKIFQAQKMFFEFANNAPNVVVEKVSFQEFHQMHQN